MKVKRHPKREETNLPFQQSRKWVESEREALQHYLHGDIPDDEVKAAASYEFARESASFRYAAAMFKKGAENEICAPFGITKSRPKDFDFLIMQLPGRAIWTCSQFPKLPWTKLPPSEKEKIQCHFARGAQRPFNTLDVDLLAGMKVIEKLQSLAEKTRKKRGSLRTPQRARQLLEKAQTLADETARARLLEKVQELREKVAFRERHHVRENPILAAVRGDQLPWVEHIVCTLNYRNGKDALVDAFRAWLDSNRTESFDAYYKPPIRKDSEHSLRHFHEALKNLTAARLYATLGFREAKKWTVENHKLKNGARRGYFGQKIRKKLNPRLKYLKKSESGAYKGGALFEERRQWEKALKKSMAVLKTLSGFGLMLE
jgi:hypothetical protein